MADQTLNVTLTGDDAERLGRIMRSGGYETYEAVVGDALASLEACSGASIVRWLQDIVAKRVDAHHADTSRRVPFEEARRRVLGPS